MPGYYPESAFANGKPVAHNRRFNRALRKDEPIKKMLTRVGFDGSVRQTLLPVAAHDVEVAPDRSIGVLCSMDGDQHSSFDPETLEMAAVGPSLGNGWRGGGHAVYVDGGATVILSERAPAAPYQGSFERHYGRLTVMLSPWVRVEPLFDIGPGAFRPPPKVVSTVVRLTPHEQPLPIGDARHFATVVAAAFSQRRKTLRNSLKPFLSVEDIAAAGIDPGRRAETVTLTLGALKKEGLVDAAGRRLIVKDREQLAARI